jgi:pyruvate-ferredoxin/flavodoxin oxidoreductase
MHLIVAAVEAATQERVGPFVVRLEELIRSLEEKVGGLLVTTADIEAVDPDATVSLEVALEGPERARFERLRRRIRELRDLHWRYTSGPSGKGRASLSMANATGCSSVWASTYPYNPYPFPWVSHLFQDAPSLAIGIFEGQMRKMADAFRSVRKAELEVEDAYDPEVHDPFFAAFDWQQFSDEEFLLCPPVFAVGGDGAMADIGFQNLSRMLASGKPLRAVVLDTQVYSNTGGQACTAGFAAQVSDMATYGAAQHGKQEVRKELALIAMAHRTSFVLQSSQASHSHLLAGVLRGLGSRRPAIFNIYDPDAGPALADRLELDGNPALEDPWPGYELSYRDEGGAQKRMTLPVTIADWAASEVRFARHFTEVKRSSWDDRMVPFHEYLELSSEARAGKQPFVYSVDSERRLARLVASQEIVRLAEERLALWRDLREMAGREASPRLREEVATAARREFEEREAALRADYEAKLSQRDLEQRRRIVGQLCSGLLGEQPPAPDASNGEA